MVVFSLFIPYFYCFMGVGVAMLLWRFLRSDLRMFSLLRILPRPSSIYRLGTDLNPLACLLFLLFLPCLVLSSMSSSRASSRGVAPGMGKSKLRVQVISSLRSLPPGSHLAMHASSSSSQGGAVPCQSPSWAGFSNPTLQPTPIEAG